MSLSQHRHILPLLGISLQLVNQFLHQRVIHLVERNYCIVCYSAADAIEILDKYMHNRTIENLSIVKGGERIGTVR